MGNKLTQREIVNQDGETIQYNATVGTTAVSVPSSPIANRYIELVTIVTTEFTGNQKLLVDLNQDGTFTTFKRGIIYAHPPKGRVSQIDIKGDQAGVNYQVIINYGKC